MLNFEVNQQTCTKCGLCVADCPARIISMADGFPDITPENEAACYKCQHCLAICPTGAVSILGLKPEESTQLGDNFHASDQLENLIKGRRSVRSYKPENLAPEVIERLLSVACHAPSGMNSRQVRFTVVDDREKLARLRTEIMSGLSSLLKNQGLPKGLEFFADFIRLWEEKGVDILFRGAPHLLIASAPQQVASPIPDCLISLSYFELFAQSMGIGTVWDGLAKLAINDLLPEFKTRLQIPEDHVIGYMMAFGKPAVRYARTVQHTPAMISRVEI